MDIGVIGTGAMGKNHVRVYSELKNVGNVVVYDLNAAAASEVAKNTGTDVATSVEDLFRMLRHCVLHLSVQVRDAAFLEPDVEAP